jgi:uncharacterized protein YbcV (DUF1398 family)
MFTIDQIQESHSRQRNGADFPAFVQSLIKMGVTGYNLFLQDRHAEYFGKKGKAALLEDAKYPEYTIAPKWDSERFMNILTNYRQGKLNYSSFYEQLTRAGVEKLSLDMKTLTCTYYGIDGAELHVEQLRKP